jgi:hypothetical protein
MADNLVTAAGRVATKEYTNSGELAHGQKVILVGPLGEVIAATVANGLAVDVQRVVAPVAITKARVPLTPVAPTAVSVGVASGVAVAQNLTRKGLTLINTSVNWISLSEHGGAAVLYSGITLAPNGGSYTMNDFDFTTNEIRAIASGVASNLAIQEYN